jgi:PKD repeat protein
MKSYIWVLVLLVWFGVIGSVYAQINFTTNLTSPQCPETNTGAIEVIPSGGTGPFTITLTKNSSNPGQAEQLVTSAGAFTFNGLRAGQYSILVSANGSGCQQVRKQVLLVDPQNFFGSLYQEDSSCAPCDVNLISSFQPVNDFSYAWSNNQSGRKITGICDGDYTLTVTKISTGCQKQYSITAKNTVPEITLNSLGSICVNESRSFSYIVSSTTTGECFSINPDSVLWDFGDGNTSTEVSPNHTYNSSGSYTILLTVNGGLTATETVQVNQGYISFYNNIDCSEARKHSFTSSTSCASNADFLWDFGDPNSGSNSSTDQNPSHTFSTTGNFTVTLTVGSQTQTAEVIVLDNPNQLSTITSSATSCRTRPLSRQFSGNLTCCQNYKWNFGDPASGASNTSTATYPEHNFSGPGTYLVTLIADSGAFYGVSKTLSVVVENPVAISQSPDAILSSLTDSVSIGPSPQSGFSFYWQHGQVGSPISVKKPGMYIVFKSDPANQNACFGIDTILVNYCGQFVLANEDKLYGTKISVFPNPVIDWFHVSGDIEGRFRILNVQGQIMKEGNLRENAEGFPSTGLSDGLYFFLWKAENGYSGNVKFLVER